MNRVLVIGCPGSGKSTFARTFAQRTGLPVIHLDQHYWQTGWTEPSRDAWRNTLAKLLSEPQWVMDGYYGNTIETRLRRADTVFFIDTPRWFNIASVIRRTLRDYGRTRADLPADCPERFDWLFLKYVWNFNRKHRHKILAVLNNYDGKVITFRSRAEVAKYLERFTLSPTT